MTNPDNEIENVNKHFLSLANHQFENLLNSHVATSNYKVPTKTENHETSEGNDRVFHTNNSVWEAIIFEKFRRTNINIILDGFFLFEWFPRSPGLFHTSEGIEARRKASNFIDSVENGVLIYNYHGKASMLDGGVGNVRLKPIEVKEETFFLMSASASGTSHEGFPIALPESLYNTYIDEIKNRGAFVGKVFGKLKFIPDELSKLYTGYIGVPQLYLQVDKIASATHTQSRRMTDLKVSVAVSFLSNFEGHKNPYATYVNFDPSNQDSFRDAINWMENDYVIGKYSGQIITDFDQQEATFKDAPFSLEKVMNLTLSQAEVQNVTNTLHFNSIQIIEHQNLIINKGGQVKVENNEYKNEDGQQVIIKDNAIVNDINQIQNSDTSSKEAKKNEQYLAYGFGLVFIVVILVLAIVFPTPTQFQYTVFRIILALAAAGIAAFIPGFLQVDFKNVVRASGAIAVFVVVYFFSPAQLAILNIQPSATIQVIEQPIKEAIKDVASLGNKTVKITNCDDNFLASKIKPGIITGKDISDIISQLQYRLEAPISKQNYIVEKLSEGVYEVICRN